MDDLMTGFYDDDAAVRFCVTNTGQPEDVVRAILLAMGVYKTGIGINPSDMLVDVEGVDQAEATPNAIRDAAPTFFPADFIEQRYLSPPLERAYVMQRTGLDERTVRSVQDAEFSYMQKLGLVEDA